MNPYRYAVKPEFDFKNPEDFKKLEKMAYDMSIDISGFPPAAYRYFDKLKILYAEFKYDSLPKEIAERQKLKLYADYIEATSAYEQWVDDIGERQDNIRKAGTLLSDIEKAYDVKTVAELACEVIGIMTGDKCFFERQRKKWSRLV